MTHLNMTHPTSAARFVATTAAVLFLSACASGAPAHPPMASPVTGPTAPAESMVAAVPEEGVDFVVYRSDGTVASLEALMSGLGDVEVLLLGEEHNDVVGHRLQLEIFRRVLADHGGRGPMASPARAGSTPSGDDRSVVLSLEMFERDVQMVVDEYLNDLITEDHFLLSSRPWDNYDRDYRPLVELARETGTDVVAANAPRRYVNRASRLGRSALESLSEEAQEWLPPLPYPQASTAYKAEWDALMGGAAMHGAGDPLDGQTLWDASMGESIVRALERAEEDRPLVVHLAGGFHVQNGTGIPEAIEHYRPGTRQRLVSVRAVPDPERFVPEMAGAGDFVVLTRAPEGG